MGNHVKKFVLDITLILKQLSKLFFLLKKDQFSFLKKRKLGSKLQSLYKFLRPCKKVNSLIFLGMDNRDC